VAATRACHRHRHTPQPPPTNGTAPPKTLIGAGTSTRIARRDASTVTVVTAAAVARVARVVVVAAATTTTMTTPLPSATLRATAPTRRRCRAIGTSA
jgi:hypothetical protein